MGRSKEMGKPVAELTPEELRRERVRCLTFIRAVGSGPAVKSLRKRLLQISRRLAE